VAVIAQELVNDGSVNELISCSAPVINCAKQVLRDKTNVAVEPGQKLFQFKPRGDVTCFRDNVVGSIITVTGMQDIGAVIRGTGRMRSHWRCVNISVYLCGGFKLDLTKKSSTCYSNVNAV
jgi:hypothetical protein